MYKRLYLNQNVPDSRQSYNLRTDDINGAIPKLLNSADLTLKISDPEIFKKVQAKQINDCYTSYKKNKDKQNYNLQNVNNIIKSSKISSFNIFNPTNYKEIARDIRYDRNLKNQDIEGSSPYEYSNQILRNKLKAQKIINNGIITQNNNNLHNTKNISNVIKKFHFNKPCPFGTTYDKTTDPYKFEAKLNLKGYNNRYNPNIYYQDTLDRIIK